MKRQLLYVANGLFVAGAALFFMGCTEAAPAPAQPTVVVTPASSSQGPAGQTGAPGPTGSQGPTGATGAPGN